MRSMSSQNKVRTAFAALTLLLCATFATAAPTRTVLVMGDSLSAAYGLAADQGWVSLLGQRLEQTRSDWQVINASVSGETTGGGAGRFDRALQTHKPSVVILELGANDALRGLPLEQAEANLQNMIDKSTAAGAKVLLVGIEIPPNYGPDYTEMLRLMYRTLVANNDVAFLPFLLEPIAGDLANFQADGLHPVADAQPKILDHVWAALEPVLD